ncbi:MAG: hypothetical protein VW395_06180 [Methylotenera sp.]
MIKTALKLGALSVLGLVSVSALAETAPAPIKLAMVTGNVMVNNGKSFVKAGPNAQLKPGTKIITNNNSSANLVYKNGCVKQVKPNTILTVGTQNECVAGKFTDEKIHVAAITDDNIGDAVESEKTLLSNGTYRALFTIAAIGVSAWVIYELTDGDGGSNRRIVSVSAT